MTMDKWLENEGIIDNNNGIYPTSLLMERYANYKSRKLQSQILHFRNLIKNNLSVDEGGVVTIYKGFNDNLELLEAYDEHFNLTTERLNNKL